mmetsp:Transcript_32096/g.61476  ORF Transcript_32096/g.61476 Transcript_32096/m.61476 type:complete len:107 (+) Transcript_32096:1279-1599(+)
MLVLSSYLFFYTTISGSIEINNSTYTIAHSRFVVHTPSNINSWNLVVGGGKVLLNSMPNLFVSPQNKMVNIWIREYMLGESGVTIISSCSGTTTKNKVKAIQERIN